MRYKCCSHILASVLFILCRSPLLCLYNYMFLLSVVCHIILIAINSRRNIYTCIYFAQVNFAQDYSKPAKHNRLNTFVLLAINMKFYYRPIILIQGMKGPHAGIMILYYLLFVVMQVRLILISTSNVLYCNATLAYHHHVLRSIKQTKITTYSNGQMPMYSDYYACALAINCTFIFKCVTYDHTSKIGYLEGVFDVVHLYILKILCYNMPNLSTQYPSCSSYKFVCILYY